MIRCGAEHIVCPIAFSAKDAFTSMQKGNRSVKTHANSGIKGESLSLSLFSEEQRKEIESWKGDSLIEKILVSSIQNSLKQVSENVLDGKTILLLSTTKGDVEKLKENKIDEARLGFLLNKVTEHLGFEGDKMVVSNACISGVSASILGHDLIKDGEYDHAIVCGADVATQFVVSGFQSFYAISETPCMPYDGNRKGISMGEAAATFILSSKDIFKEDSFNFLGGATANDANHISGPSRTGEGLYRSINKAMTIADINASQVDYISAHGTATPFNDDMESIAFDRAGLASVPVNSLKGYFGHTLGAAGVIELALVFQSMREKSILKSMGVVDPGTAKPMNIAMENLDSELNYVLKTASGFGGCNAAVLIGR